MTRLNLIRTGLTILLLTSNKLPFAHAQQNDSISKYTVHALYDSIFLIPVYGVNSIVAINQEKSLIVDAGYSEAAPLLFHAIEKTGAKDIAVIISTHWHYDHVGGNLTLPRPQSIIATKNTKNWLSSKQIILGDTIAPHPEEKLPDISINKDTILVFGKDTIIISPISAAHTGGDAIVYFKNADILHVGDLVFSDMFPFCDTRHGGSVLGMADNIKKIRESYPQNTLIIPGHGKPYSMKEMEAYENMLRTTHKLVMNEKQKGKSLKEIQDAQILKDWVTWAKSFTANDWITFIYEE